MKHLLLLVILFVVLLLPATIQAQDKIKLKQADWLGTGHAKSIAGDFIKGNVIFTHGNTTIYCDSAYFNRKDNSLVALGNVRMQIGNDIMTARRLKYYGNTKQADLQPETTDD